MSRLWPLFGFSLKRIRGLLLAISVILGGFQVLLVTVGNALEANGSYKQITLLVPPFVRKMIGPAFDMFVTFKGTVCLGFFHELVLAMTIGMVIVLATEPAGEKESKVADLLLSRPIARFIVLWRTALLTLFVTGWLVVVMLGSSWGALTLLGPARENWPSFKILGAIALNLEWLLLCWGSLALLISTFHRRRSSAAWMTALLAFLMALIDLGARMWNPMTPVAMISPFYYFSPFELMSGQDYLLKNSIFLLSVTIVSFCWGMWRWQKRDL